MTPARLPALLYHDVINPIEPDASGFRGAIAGRYKLTVTQFRNHLSAIAAHGPAVAVLPETAVNSSNVALQPGSGPQSTGADPSRHRFLMTFDDGGASSLHIADELEARGWRGMFFIVPSLIDQPGFLTRTDLLELHQRGHGIGSHSATHPPQISGLTPREIETEWRHSGDQLADWLGQKLRWASVPGGYFSAAVADAAARAGYEVLFTSEPTSRWWTQSGIWLAGRYAIVNTTSAASASELAFDNWSRTSLQAATWQLKKGAKQLLGPAFRLLSRQYWQSAALRPKPSQSSQASS